MMISSVSATYFGGSVRAAIIDKNEFPVMICLIDYVYIATDIAPNYIEEQ